MIPSLLLALVVGGGTWWVLSAPRPPAQVGLGPRGRRRALAGAGWTGVWIAALGTLGARLDRRPPPAHLAPLLRRAGSPGGLGAGAWQSFELGVQIAAIGAVLWVLALALVGALPLWLVGLAPALLGASIVPRQWVLARGRGRALRLAGRLPDLADRLAIGLVAGLPPSDALEHAVQTEGRSPRCPRWLWAELTLAARLVRLSDHGLTDGLAHLQRVLPSEALDQLASQIATADDTGGRVEDALRAFAQRRRAVVAAERSARMGLLTGKLVPALALPVFAFLGVSIHYVWGLMEGFLDFNQNQWGVG